MECSSCCVDGLVQAFVEADLERNMGRCQSKRIKEAIQKLREAMQNVCLTCVDEVNDNNPSNHGQTFYSLDSGHCQSNAGHSSNSHSDNNEVISRADWINSHASYDSAYYKDNSFRPYSENSPLDPSITAMRRAMRRKSFNLNGGMAPSMAVQAQVIEISADDKFFDPEGDANAFQDDYSITTLPSAVEAILLREMNNFAALPALHKMLICCLLAGINLSDFARMSWLPKEIKRMMKPRAKDAPDVISAQTAHAIYQNICRKLPYLTVLARATKKRSKERVATQNAAIRDYQRANSRYLSYMNSPKDMKAIGKPKENPHHILNGEESDARSHKKASRISEKKARQEYLNHKYQQQDMFALA